MKNVSIKLRDPYYEKRDMTIRYRAIVGKRIFSCWLPFEFFRDNLRSTFHDVQSLKAFDANQKFIQKLTYLQVEPHL